MHLTGVLDGPILFFSHDTTNSCQGNQSRVVEPPPPEVRRLREKLQTSKAGEEGRTRFLLPELPEELPQARRSVPETENRIKKRNNPPVAGQLATSRAMRGLQRNRNHTS